MTARGIALALAGPRAQRLADGSYLMPCPVPSHGKGRGDRNPSLRIGDGQLRLLVHCYGGCDPHHVLDELRRRGFLDGERRARREPQIAPAAQKSGNDHERQQRQKAAWLWSQRKPILGSIAETYVRSRGITCPLPETLAFLSAHKPEHHPAMIAAFALVDEPEPGMLGIPRHAKAVHLTLLRPDGSGKADVDKPKLIVGSPLGLPINVAPPNDLMGLAITEGVEDALSVHQSTGLGAWAAGAAGFMPKLANVVPSYVEAVTIYAHADKAGQDGAHKLADALHKRQPRENERPIEVVVEGI
jgi:putative DNA primase/helicase